jgi:hypothetical protein
MPSSPHTKHPNHPVKPGQIYRHPDQFDTEYVILQEFLWVDKEEEGGPIVPAVLYMQTVAGMYPVGTVYARTLEDFLATTVYNGKTVPKFQHIKTSQDEPLASSS